MQMDIYSTSYEGHFDLLFYYYFSQPESLVTCSLLLQPRSPKEKEKNRSEVVDCRLLVTCVAAIKEPSKQGIWLSIVYLDILRTEKRI